MNFFRAAVFALMSSASVSAVEAAESTAKLIDQAKELLDTYYGDGSHLTSAAALLDQARARDAREATLYVQAARLAVMGGHVVGNTFQGNAVEAYGALARKALAIDPRDKTAHLLLAEWNDIRGPHEPTPGTSRVRPPEWTIRPG